MRKVAALAGAAVLLSCQASRSGAPLPPEPSVVHIVMTEWRIERPPVIPGGRVVFIVHNAGKVDHVLQLAPLPEDFPPIAQQASGALPPRDTLELAATPLQSPGQIDQFSVDLRPGRYALVDLIKDAHHVTNAAKGMTTEFRIPGTPSNIPLGADPEKTGQVPLGLDDPPAAAATTTTTQVTP